MRIFTLILLLFVSVARAEIPLELVEEIQLPENVTAWDVQHWMDDETYGWAALVGNTVVYQLTLEDSVRTYSISDSFYWIEWNGNTPENYEWVSCSHSRIRLFRDPANDNHAAIIMESRLMGIGQPGDGCELIVDWYHIVDLEEGIISDSLLSVQDVYRCLWGSQVQLESNSLSFVLWPPSPLPSTHAIFTRSQHSISDFIEDTEDWNGFGEAISLTTLASSFMYNTYWAVPFNIYNSVLLATFNGGHHLYYPDNVNSPDHHETWTSLGTRTLTTSDTVPECNSEYFYYGENDSASGEACPVANEFFVQMNSNGTGRIIQLLAGQQDCACFDASTLSQIWTNQTMRPDFTAMVTVGEDERILQRTPDSRFIDYDAENGQPIDTTTAVIGSVSSILKCPNRVSEIVTETGGLVRIYKFLPYTFDLSLQYNSEVNLLYLSWNGRASNVIYHIYRSSSSSVPFEQMDYVATTDTNYFELAPTHDKEFFRVTAVY